MTKYNKEYRESALVLSDEIGVKKAAEQLGMNLLTLKYWRRERNKKSEEEKNRKPVSQAEIEALKKENAELKKANEILKDAMGFFIKDRKK